MAPRQSRLLHDLFANPIYAGVYAYGVRAVEKRRQKPGRPGTGRRSPRAGEAEVFLHDCLPAYISFERYRPQPSTATIKQSGVGRYAAGRNCASLRPARLWPLRPAHAGPIQQQRPCGALRLPA